MNDLEVVEIAPVEIKEVKEIVKKEFKLAVFANDYIPYLFLGSFVLVVFIYIYSRLGE